MSILCILVHLVFMWAHVVFHFSLNSYTNIIYMYIFGSGPSVTT